ncbi:MAG: trypsin-like peptidase domain-containing protein [Candidatus Aminicenantes bacterium]|nr:trypsin-like peptidase domain-containing protein [Candidatus Aminicenantes bacterium]
MIQRHQLIKESTVQVFINGQPSGTGFIISEDGLIGTCYHVVQYAQPAANGQTQITYASNIEVVLHDKKRFRADVHSSCQNSNFVNSVSKDFCILQISCNNLKSFPIGNFGDATEGSNIYLCGYPLGINQPVVSKGMLSTK